MPYLATPTTLPAERTGAHAPGPGAASASVLVRDLLTGPVRPAAVVAAGPRAAYLDVGGRLVAIVAAGGVRLPCAVVLVDPAARPPGVAVSGPAGPGPAVGPALADGRPAALAVGTASAVGRPAALAVGEGAVHVGGHRAVAVRRWFDPRVRLTGLDPAAVARLRATVRARPCGDALLPAGAAGRLAEQLAGGRHRAAVSELVGRGTGLTPAGDDLLAGALAALRAARSPAADGLGAATRDLVPGRTSHLSAALLVAADEGAVVPEAEAVLRALVPPHAPGLAVGDAVDRAAGRLLGVGHTSGWHLAAGLAVGAAHALDPPARPHRAAAGSPSTAGLVDAGLADAGPRRVPAGGRSR